jgi:acetyl esterase/lipase
MKNMMKIKKIIVWTNIILLALCNIPLFGQEKIGPPAPLGYPKEVRDIQYKSNADGTNQPALFYAPNSKTPVPLLVSLHTWSNDYKQTMQIPCAEWCVKKGWAFIQPNFRGPNIRPEATGSELVVKDIVSAVNYAEKNANIDKKRFYLLGHSGGGYATLLMAGQRPDIWAAASAWCPISDLTEWYQQCQDRKIGYTAAIAKSCGGNPLTDTKAAEEAKKRSAITYLAAAKNLPLDINAGIHDGHNGNSVPVLQSLNAFNLLAEPNDRLSPKQIKILMNNTELPEKTVN